jgi:hypothetical protein
MCWNLLPAVGTAWGILVGIKNLMFDLVGWQCFQFCAAAIIKNQLDNLVWRVIVVYGSPYEEGKLEFLAELHEVMASWSGPTLIGGDFNLVRFQKEKSNDIINFIHSSAFNEWGLIEIKDHSRAYIWSNNQ